MIRKTSTMAVLAAFLAAGVSIASAAATEKCRPLTAKGEAGHTSKAEQNALSNLRDKAKEFGSRITRSSVDCRTKSGKVICHAQGTACK